MKKVIALAVAVTSLMAYQANATVAINIAAGDLTAGNGSVIPAGALAILVADTTGTAVPNNLSSNSALSVGSDLTLTVTGDTYQVIGAWNSSAASGQAGLLEDTTGAFSLTAPLAAAQALYVMWFPSLTLASSTSGAGTSYGEFGGVAANAEAVGNSSDLWALPANGATINIYALTSDNGGVSTSSDLKAILVTPVPEPSSIALVVIGLFGAVGMLRRRRS